MEKAAIAQVPQTAHLCALAVGAHPMHHHSRLTPEVPLGFRLRRLDAVKQVTGQLFHRSFLAHLTTPRISRRRAEIVSKPYVMKEQRRHIYQAVDAVQNATVAGDYRPHVFDPKIAFENADDEVA